MRCISPSNARFRSHWRAAFAEVPSFAHRKRAFSAFLMSHVAQLRQQPVFHCLGTLGFLALGLFTVVAFALGPVLFLGGIPQPSSQRRKISQRRNPALSLSGQARHLQLQGTWSLFVTGFCGPAPPDKEPGRAGRWRANAGR